MRTAVIVGAAAALVAGGLGSWTMANAETGYGITFDPHGGQCSGSMEITVPSNGWYTVPSEGTGNFECHRDMYSLAGWSHRHFVEQPGSQARVPVVSAGGPGYAIEHTTLYAVWIPQGVEIIYDSNVHEDDECLDHSGNNVPVEERTSPAILHKADHHIAHHAPCTPPGHVLQGWVLKTDRGAAARSGSMLQGRRLRADDALVDPSPEPTIAPSPSAAPPTPPPTQGPDPTPPPAAPTVEPGSQVSDSGLDSGTTPTLVADWGPHHISVPTSDPTSKPTIDPVLPTPKPTATPLPTSTPSDPLKARCDLAPAPYVDWHDCDKSGVSFLSGPPLHGANLSGANFSGAALANGDLSDANASNADFSNTNLMSTTLSGTNFSSASLEYADLSGAQGFSSANISGANFADATWLNGQGCDSDSPAGECTVNGVKQSQD